MNSPQTIPNPEDQEVKSLLLSLPTSRGRTQISLLNSIPPPHSNTSFAGPSLPPPTPPPFHPSLIRLSPSYYRSSQFPCPFLFSFISFSSFPFLSLYLCPPFLAPRQMDEDIESEVWQMCSVLRDLELNKEAPHYFPHCSTAPFVLYLALAEFSRYQEHVPAGERRALLLGTVWPHFMPFVSRWVDVTCYRVLCRIRIAILTDRVANTGEPVQSMSGAADYYVYLLQQRLHTLATDTQEDERAQQLCITVNNMSTCAHSLTLLRGNCR
ncbi:hypothetical protein C7M84_012571 [Penaeus vannamei]|uniref:Uncharacterized protein n=1 Tax=Penaeus vannamei TaxID=6689 RepID=A0A3R7QJ93_PENVA|nr:hypothetical protein C7M84_012571 [Penaeus vannamei]